VPNGRYAVLSASDNGCGMDERTQARIFDPFFTTKAPGEGTGLGLSMAHGVVTALGGAITVYSKVGKGSTFRLYFPASDEQPSEPRRPSARRLGQGQQVLLVDDEPMIMELGREMLESLGYRATSFERARDALAAFRRDPMRYAAAVTDLSMPTMSGFDLARELLAIRPDLPILLMSGYIGPDERAAAARIGVREMVLKPVSMERLSELLAELCSL
jgi:CheY-like chemotaxis protein